MHKPPLPTPRARLAAPAGTALIQQALALMHADNARRVLPRLRRIYFGLICEDACSAEAVLFERAASDLGGRVAHIRPEVAQLDREMEVQSTALWLGRLYDAVECQGLPASRVEEIRNSAGIPVFDCLSCQSNGPALDALRSEGAAELDARRYVLQAVLLSMFG